MEERSEEARPVPLQDPVTLKDLGLFMGEPPPVSQLSSSVWTSAGIWFAAVSSCSPQPQHLDSCLRPLGPVLGRVLTLVLLQDRPQALQHPCEEERGRGGCPAPSPTAAIFWPNKRIFPRLVSMAAAPWTSACSRWPV